MICLKGLLIDTSRDCNLEVHPPGMIRTILVHHLGYVVSGVCFEAIKCEESIVICDLVG